MSNLGPLLNKPLQLKHVTEGLSPQLLDDFYRKNSDLNFI